MNTDDLDQIPHVVIVESESGIRIVEFEREAKPSPMLAAHGYATNMSGGSFHGRIIVAARVRTLQPLSYLKKHEKPQIARQP